MPTRHKHRGKNGADPKKLTEKQKEEVTNFAALIETAKEVVYEKDGRGFLWIFFFKGPDMRVEIVLEMCMLKLYLKLFGSVQFRCLKFLTFFNF